MFLPSSREGMINLGNGERNDGNAVRMKVIYGVELGCV